MAFTDIPVRLNDDDILADWFNTLRTELVNSLIAPGFPKYVNDAAFVAAKGSPAVQGDYYYNTSLDTLRNYGSSWFSVSNATLTEIYSNKTIDGNSNTLTVLAASQLSGQVPFANGGTGEATRQAAIDALTNVSSATNGYVLTRDTNGNAVFEAATGGAASLNDIGDVNVPSPSDEDFLMWDNGTSKWIAVSLPAPTRSAMRYSSNNGQDVNGGILEFEVQDYDDDSMYNTGTGLATVPIAGVWDITAGLLTATAAWGVTGALQILIRINGTTVISDALTRCWSAQSVSIGAYVATEYELAVNDTVEVFGVPTTTTTMANNTRFNWFSMSLKAE